MKKLISTLLISLALSMFTAANSTVVDTIASVDSVDFTVQVEIEGKFNNPVITFPDVDDFLDLTGSFYDQKLELTSSMTKLLDEYVVLSHESNSIKNKSSPLKYLNDMNISIKEYKKAKIKNKLLLLISIIVSYLLYSLFTNSYQGRGFENMRVFQLTLGGLVQTAFTTTMLYLILSLIFNKVIFLL